MRDIIDGFLRFQREVYPQRVELFKQLATTQNPKALFVTGNIVPSYGPEPGGVSATVEYAVAVLGVQDIVICGHSDAAKAINAAHEFDTPRAKLDGLVREK